LEARWDELIHFRAVSRGGGSAGVVESAAPTFVVVNTTARFLIFFIAISSLQFLPNGDTVVLASTPKIVEPAGG
jgi:hypothetical protein